MSSQDKMLRSVFNKQRERIAAAGLGKDWETLRGKLAGIRQQRRWPLR